VKDDAFRAFTEARARFQALSENRLLDQLNQAARMNERILGSLPSTLDALGRIQPETVRALAKLQSFSVTPIQPDIVARLASVATPRTVLLGPVLTEVQKLADVWTMQQRQLQSLVDAFTRTEKLIRGTDFSWITKSFANYVATLPPFEWLMARALESRGWWLVPRWDDAMLERLQEELDASPTGRALTSWIVTYYLRNRARRLSRLARSWELPEFKANGRRALLEQALRCVRRGDYAIALHGVNGLFEGVLKDYLYNENVITDHVRRSASSPVTLFDKHLSIRRPYLDGFVAQLKKHYRRYTGPTGRARQVNRHGQAHGGEAAPNSAAEVVRAFLLLDTLHFHLDRARKLANAKSA
jgi:hypothetical protein